MGLFDIVATDNVEVRLALTFGVFVLLGLISWRFNARIDNIPTDELHDGQTALQVAFGTTYTLVGLSIIVATWTNLAAGIALFVLAFLTFAASGWPMYRGDSIRAHKRRKEQGQ